MERQPLTTGQIAKYCGVNFRTVIRWIERGQLKAFKLPGRGDNRIEVRHFLEFLTTHKMPMPPELAAIRDRVLVVNGDLLIAERIERALVARGLDTRVAEGCFQAGAMLGTFSPGIVVLDMEMPAMNGIDVIRFIRSSDEFKNIRLLVIATAQDQCDEACAAGADDAVPGPIAPELLAQKVMSMAGKA